MEAVPGIGVITNPRSKANKRDPAGMHRLGYLLGSRGEMAATKSLDDLYRVAEQFKAAEIDVLGINGGDGTIHVTLTAFLKVYAGAPLPKIAILCGGTLNTIAAGLGIAGTPDQLLFEVIDQYHSGEEFKIVQRPIMKIDQHYGFLFGNGLVANFLEAYYATGKPSPSTGAWLVARTIASAMWRGPFIRRIFRRVMAQVKVDGREWEQRDFATVIAATVPEIGIGFRPFYRCMESLEQFALVGFTCKPMGLIGSLPRIYRGLPVKKKHAISVLASEMTIVPDQDVAYTIDGDLHQHKAGTEMRLGVGPVLDLIVPEAPG